MKILKYHSNSVDFSTLPFDIESKSPDEVWFISETEWEWPFSDELINVLTKHKPKIKILLGCYKGKKHEDLAKSLGININDFIFWPTYFFNWGENALKNEFDYTKSDNTNLYIPFINYNGNPHIHRCHLVDQLARLNLIDKGVVSWNIRNDNFSFRYFDNKIREKDNYLTLLHSYIISQEYQNTFLECIGEATSYVPFITEKTVRPLLMKKPFFVLGSYRYSNYLKYLGFELYDEIIDYEYDQVEDLEMRAIKFVENLQYIIKIKNFNKCYEKLLPKITHNFHNAIRIINDKSLFPEILNELPNVHPKYKFLYDRYVFT